MIDLGTTAQRYAYPTLYWQLVAKGNLLQYLAETEERASTLLRWLTEQTVKDEGVTESLRAEQHMVWVEKMNSIGTARQKTSRKKTSTA